MSGNYEYVNIDNIKHYVQNTARMSKYSQVQRFYVSTAQAMHVRIFVVLSYLLEILPQ